MMEPGSVRDYSITERLLRTGVKQKVFRRDIHIDIVNRTLHELFDLFSHESKMVEAGFHRKEMFDHILIPYFRGISTAEGILLLEKNRKLLD